MKRRYLLVLAFLLAAPLCAAQNERPNLWAGTYRCISAEVEGKKEECPRPELILYSDGSYQLWTEEGTYFVWDKHLVLSESRKRGAGLLKKHGVIIFQYYHENRKHTETFKRVATPPPPGSVLS